MKGKKILGYCPHCNREVSIRYSSPRHFLHLAVSVMTFGLWLIVWIYLIFHAHRFRCPHCQGPVSVLFSQCSIASLSQPWGTCGIRCANRYSRCDFNSVLIENGLVYYASTRAIRP
ncbi:hypothetical protein DENIS_2167 [Desulfonema ishimotonii]|uniref:LITAF domain-containing protein n=1 Tax=Desulfonema ishimotonii TaxID=45657 RepID=A0A401FW60_9BACT|nr:hypothetical protein [Desulfonema ishimotonii]GBC61207.1 hypothetical protein DENIS_2167 [Desulfonema ishimotonii]